MAFCHDEAGRTFWITFGPANANTRPMYDIYSEKNDYSAASVVNSLSILWLCSILILSVTAWEKARGAESRSGMKECSICERTAKQHFSPERNAALSRKLSTNPWQPATTLKTRKTYH